MIKTPINYNNTYIYKIVCKDLNITDIYVGHTTNFKSRKMAHKNTSKYGNEKVYKFIRENGSFDNFDMVIIEEIKCANFYEACARERYWIEQLKPSLNTHLPTNRGDQNDEENSEEENENSQEEIDEEVNLYKCVNCKKCYVDRSGLFKHKKKCGIIQEKEENENQQQMINELKKQLEILQHNIQLKDYTIQNYLTIIESQNKQIESQNKNIESKNKNI